MLAGCTGAGTNGSEAGTGDRALPVTLTNWMYAPGSSRASDDPVALAHVSVAPLQPGENAIEIELTDLNGAALSEASAPAEAVLTVQPLTPDPSALTPPLTRADVGAIWTTGEIDLADQGWYELAVALETADETFGAATMYILLPDPSVYGADALDLPDTDPEALALFARALNRYADWDASRWRESLGSGTDVLVATDFTLTTRPGEAPAFMADTRYTGAFRPRSDGSPPADPKFDYAGAITIDDNAWRQRDGSGWEQSATRGVTTHAERSEIYAGATNIQLTGTARIDDQDVQVITFYLPPDGGQSEAWFAWWIDPDTGDVPRMAMIASMHYMIWDFFDINGSYTIAPPPGIRMATPTAQ